MKELKTKRLRIIPLTTVEMEALTKQSQTDEHMEEALLEMYHGCVTHPKDWLWYTNWKIQLRAEGTYIGSLCFKGAPMNGTVEIGYGIDKPYQNQGYATEAVKAVMEWAFNQEGVYFLMAETDKDNLASIRVLKNNGFSFVGEGEEGPRWRNEKPASNCVLIFMSIGIAMGSALGGTLDNTSLGISMGLCFGMAIGVALDEEDKKKRKQYKENL